MQFLYYDSKLVQFIKGWERLLLRFTQVIPEWFESLIFHNSS